MVLGFMTKFGKKQTFFKEQILDGTKIHTLRADPSERWKPDKIIQMATGVRTKQYEHFNYQRDDLSRCKSIEYIHLVKIFEDVFGFILRKNYCDNYCFTENGDILKLLTVEDINQLIKNDGFNDLENGLNRDDFIKWFFPAGQDRWSGKIIHWTDKKYAE